MYLIVGGAYQGKKQFVCEKFHILKEDMLDGRTCSFEEIKKAKALHHLQDYIRRMILEDMDPMAFLKNCSLENSEILFLCNEMGSGLVPVDAFDRRYRELVGRIQCELAKQAKAVYRVYCGIGVQIK